VAFCESLPLVCSLAATQLKLSPAEALAACTVNAAHVLGRAGTLGRIAPGYTADVTLLDAPDWRYIAYHLGGDIVAGRDQGRHRRVQSLGILSRCLRRSSSADAKS
jgi:imidazolonepropionase